jgi:hypothetical protein
MTVWWYLKQGDLTVAKGCCPTKALAEREANHYAMMYGLDGPVKISYRTQKLRITHDNGKNV